nr:hypothetical protein [Tanacetum cinerariifolium]
MQKSSIWEEIQNGKSASEECVYISKVERGINGDKPLHQLLQIEFHYVSPLQQKLFGPSVVVLLKGHCKQRISNTRRARHAF